MLMMPAAFGRLGRRRQRRRRGGVLASYCCCLVLWTTTTTTANGATEAPWYRESAYFRNTTALPSLENTRLAAVVLSFNHAANVKAIADALKREPSVGAVVVAEDGSTDGSKEEWARHLRPGLDVIAHTNDVHEIRAYNNAAKAVANIDKNGSVSSVLCFLQDDDVPDDKGWAEEVMILFEAFRTERLAVISGLASEVCQIELGEQPVEHPKAMKNPKVTRPIPYVYRPSSRRRGEQPPKGSSSSKHAGVIPFMFATEAWLAPMCVRRDVFFELGGFDERLTEPGEPGIGLDIHLSLRAAVLGGYAVGLHGAEFRRGVGGHGTVSDPAKTALRLKKRQEISAHIRGLAGCRWPPPILARAAHLNRKHLKVKDEALIDDIDAKCQTFTSRPCGPLRHPSMRETGSSSASSQSPDTQEVRPRPGDPVSALGRGRLVPVSWRAGGEAPLD